MTILADVEVYDLFRRFESLVWNCPDAAGDYLRPPVHKGRKNLFLVGLAEEDLQRAQQPGRVLQDEGRIGTRRDHVGFLRQAILGSMREALTVACMM